MFALILVPVALLWSAENSEFLTKVSDAPWEYVGRTARAPGPGNDGSAALTMEMNGETFILFKQRATPPAVAEGSATTVTASR